MAGCCLLLASGSTRDPEAAAVAADRRESERCSQQLGSGDSSHVSLHVGDGGGVHLTDYTRVPNCDGRQIIRTTLVPERDTTDNLSSPGDGGTNYNFKFSFVLKKRWKIC